jgi:CSLREA domain-containing protein
MKEVALMRRFVFLTVVALMMVVLASTAQISTAAVAGTTIKVNTNRDESNTDGDCSLREAIKAANTNTKVDRCAAGSSTKQDAIHFALGEQAKITLGSNLPFIKDTSGLTIDGQNAKITVSGDDKVRVFFVVRGAKLALLHLTVANARNCGLLNNNGQVEVSNSTFSGNRGGGIINLKKSGTVTVSNSTFSGNRATLGTGGGINNFNGTLEVRNSTFSGNRSSFDTSGGGIFNDNGTLKVINSTFSGNLSAGGGGIANFRGTLTVSNSTFSKNISTFNEFASGIENFGAGKVTLKNTIVANSTKGKNCTGKITDGGYNIEDDTSCHFSAAKHSLPSTNPKLASSLADNGGSTKTIMLLKGSPAINAIPQGTNGCGTKITTDQRGVSRPQGNRCDIGAFEKRQ